MKWKSNGNNRKKNYDIWKLKISYRCFGFCFRWLAACSFQIPDSTLKGHLERWFLASADLLIRRCTCLTNLLWAMMRQEMEMAFWEHDDSPPPTSGPFFFYPIWPQPEVGHSSEVDAFVVIMGTWQLRPRHRARPTHLAGRVNHNNNKKYFKKGRVWVQGPRRATVQEMWAWTKRWKRPF